MLMGKFALLTWQICFQVKLFVNKLTSTKTQVPYDYYSLPYCKPKKFGLQTENLGEVLSGDRIENSVYKVLL
jgi:transmembrane 9 superfamily protein 2/4